MLKQTDPRFSFLLEFANENVKNDELVRLVKTFSKIAPEELQLTGRAKNPYPNVDAITGSLLMHFGLKDMEFYTVLFGISRAFGVLSSLVWSRALGLPIERPSSETI